MMSITQLTIVVFLYVCINGVSSKSITCKGIGVFTQKAPYHHWPLPNCPEDLDLQMALFTRKNILAPIYMEIGTVPSMLQENKRTIFVIHGYAEYHQKWQDLLRLQLLQKGDFNIIEIYWDSVKIYMQSASDTRAVGAAVGEMAIHLAAKHGIVDMWCVGHSLGAHTCGLAGKRFPNFNRITGLDPAGPMFRNNKQAGLVKESAKYVDAIHTDGSFYGEMRSVGHTDFYINGGRLQPGCS